MQVSISFDPKITQQTKLFAILQSVCTQNIEQNCFWPKLFWPKNNQFRLFNNKGRVWFLYGDNEIFSEDREVKIFFSALRVIKFVFQKITIRYLCMYGEMIELHYILFKQVSNNLIFFIQSQRNFFFHTPPDY